MRKDKEKEAQTHATTPAYDARQLNSQNYQRPSLFSFWNSQSHIREDYQSWTESESNYSSPSASTEDIHQRVALNREVTPYDQNKGEEQWPNTASWPR